MMVTGDYHATALAVARGTGMVPTDSPLVIIQSQAEFCPSTKGLVTMPSALKSPKPASRVSHQAESVGARDQQEEEQAPGGSVAMPSALMSPSPSMHASQRAVSFGIWDQQEEEEAPGGSWAMAPALMSPKSALNAPHRSVKFVANDQQAWDEAPESSLTVAPAKDCPRLPTLATRGSGRSVSFQIGDHLEEEKMPPEGPLRFQLDNGDVFQEGDALRAFTSIAQVGFCSKMNARFVIRNWYRT